MQGPKFQRRKEDFVCEHCGAQISGDGFTNHCPACLWSKHVDIHPGDRAENCQGLMSPIAVESRREGYRIKFRCQECGIERWNKSVEEDNFDTLLEIARQHSEGK